jgi:hypothetical protein
MMKKPIYKFEELPDDYQKLAKVWSGAFNFIIGRKEYGTAITVWEHAGVYKIIRLFKFRGALNISIDVECGNIKTVMEKLLLKY